MIALLAKLSTHVTRKSHLYAEKAETTEKAGRASVHFATLITSLPRSSRGEVMSKRQVLHVFSVVSALSAYRWS
jgi:hypothetical protein